MKYSATLVIAVILLSLSMCTPKKQAKESYTDFDRGYRYWYYDKIDSAYAMFTSYLKHPDDTLKKARAYKFMGEIKRDFGDFHDAEENLLEAIKMLDPENEEHHEELSYIYNDLGNIYLGLNTYDAAINYYNRAGGFADNTSFAYEVMNGKATTFQKQKNYNAAIIIYDSILSEKQTDQALTARAIDNRANTKWLQNPQYNPLPELWEALKLRTDSQNLSGRLASYDHLSDYYTTHQPDSALWYAKEMLTESRKTKSSEDILKAIQKLVILDGNLGNKERLFKEYITLSDSIQSARNASLNRFAVLKYDFQSIKEDNFSLKRLTDRLQLFTVIIVILSLGIITSLALSFRRRRMRIQQDAELSIRNSKLKTSQRVHDVVANGLYVIMNELEHGSTIDKEPLMTKIEGLYERSRNISYEDATLSLSAGFDSRVQEMLTGFASEQTKVIAVGNGPAFWSSITTAQKHELELVLKELMVNMKKHSQATHVALVFRQEHARAFITYTDDGKGLKEAAPFGNGLNNTVSRIKSLHGDIIFGKSEKAGLSIEMSFPLQPYNI